MSHAGADCAGPGALACLAIEAEHGDPGEIGRRAGLYMRDAMARQERHVKRGDTVKVLPAYRMGGSFHNDEWTGRTMHVVHVNPVSLDCLLATYDPRCAEWPDRDDGDVWIVAGRLEVMP